ncbi:hypothetical protein DYBT9623_04423 [Dyadobacter sp. CECT 9623]|uniref:Uncharacterized protein n=1 Tax=Dyadobacter linearis TaxID=2823330 RepID=A0ABN7RCF0_9BACT|nr:hypothetical protein [Dyadobacter sp. CECT 9623]CAG5072883.1 hypothetical protein DYBT9623_04423 [Dyadobacter sp. CECT 9623]
MKNEVKNQGAAFEFDYVSLNFSVSGRDTSTGEQKSFSYNDSAQLNFNDESELNKTLKDKSYLLEVIPRLVQRALNSYDPENQDAKRLREEIGLLLQ